MKLAEEDLKQAESRANESRAALLPDFEGYVQYQNETTNLAALRPHILEDPDPRFLRSHFRRTLRRSGRPRLGESNRLRFQLPSAAIKPPKSPSKPPRPTTKAPTIRSPIRWRAPTWPGCGRKPRSTPQRANVELSESLLRLAQQQKAAGTGTGIEITRAEVQLANDRQALLVAENDVDRTQPAVAQSDRSQARQSGRTHRSA